MIISVISIKEVLSKMRIENNLFLLPKENDDKAIWILLEYLNSVENQKISEELDKLNSFKLVWISKSEERIEEYIVTALEGYNEYNGKYYAPIAGAHDKSPTIVFDGKRNSIFLLHPNESEELLLEMSIEDIIFALEYKQQKLHI